MMKCKNCGRPMGKNGRCTYCDRERAQKRQAGRKKRILLLSACALVLVAAAVAAVLLLTGREQPKNNNAASVTETAGKHHVQIEIQDYGTISLALDADAAPITVENFLTLARSGFYDGLTFHRIMEGFMMQGGDPDGNGTGGSEKTIPGEFSANGVENPLSHTRGAISMARSQDMDSASSQFFIVQKDSTFLDGNYACFGYVTDGMDVVDAVCEAARPTDDNGTIPADEQPVITKLTVID